MIKRILMLCVLVGTLFAQSDWVENGQMSHYPAKTFFYAVGIGSSAEQARNNAFVEIRQQISVQVKATQLSEEYDRVEGDTWTQSSLYESRARLVADGNVQGVEIIETANRGDIFYAFATLEKEKFISAQKLQIRELQDQLSQMVESAKANIASGNVTDALMVLTDAREIREQLHSARTLLSAGTPLTDAERIPVSQAEIDNMMVSCLASVKVKVVSGNKQITLTGKMLEEPFVLSVTVGDKAVPRFPFVLRDKKRRTIQSGISDADGMVVFFLDTDMDMSRGSHRFTVEPEIKSDKRNRSILSGMKKTLSYTVEVEEMPVQVRVVVSPDLKGGISQIESAVQVLLSEHGFVRDACACALVTVTISDMEREHIQGLSQARTLVRSDVSIDFALTDKKNGREKYRVVIQQLGASNDRIRAVADGIKKAKLRSHMEQIVSVMPSSMPVVMENGVPKPKEKIAVFPFKNTGYISYWYQYSRALSTMITTSLVNTGVFEVLERDQLEHISSELEFGESEVAIARRAGATLAVVGNAWIAPGGMVEIDVRIVDIATGVVKSAVSASAKNIQDFRTSVNELIKKLNLPTPSAPVKTDCCN